MNSRKALKVLKRNNPGKILLKAERKVKSMWTRHIEWIPAEIFGKAIVGILLQLKEKSNVPKEPDRLSG